METNLNVQNVRNVLFKKYVAEAIGTFFLVFFGCGTVVFGNGQTTHLGIGLSFGLTVVAMAYTFGNVSGCHLNPAITLAMIVNRHIDLRTGLFYMVSQCFGSIVASGLQYSMLVGRPHYKIDIHGLGQNYYGDQSPDKWSVGSCFAAEVIFTGFFVLVVLGSTSKKTGHTEQAMSGLVIGLTLTVIHLAGINITGVSVNPARSLGPALYVSNKAIEQLWLFWTAPFVGAIAASFLWKLFFDEEFQKAHNLGKRMDGIASQPLIADDSQQNLQQQYQQ